MISTLITERDNENRSRTVRIFPKLACAIKKPEVLTIEKGDDSL
jgi:hypothetical protein